MTTSRINPRVLHHAEQFQAAPFGDVFIANKPVIGGRSADGEVSAGLFYWSHSRFNDDFEFGLHHHEGFEIATFILDGTNSHYDTSTRAWVDLGPGDVQIIRSGSGISHNERVAKGTRAFQIWWDPGYREALGREPSYTDHSAHTFASHTVGNIVVTNYIGADGPVHALTEGLSVRRVTLASAGNDELEIGTDRFTVAYVIDGHGTVNGASVTDDDAIYFEGASTANLSTNTSLTLFLVSVPSNPSYQPVRQS